jgi:hypothetical protein
LNILAPQLRALSLTASHPTTGVTKLAITKDQKAALEAVGYTVKGNTVKTKDGGSVGGYNENGKIWSGSNKVRDILKSQPEAPQKTTPKAAPKTVVKKVTQPAKGVSSGRGDGAAEVKRRNRDAPKVSSGRGSGTEEVKRRTSDTVKKEASSGQTIATPRPGGLSGSRRTPATGKPYNPSFSGGKGSAEGFQGRYETGVAKQEKTGGKRVKAITNQSSKAEAPKKPAAKVTTPAKPRSLPAAPRGLPPPETGFRGQTPSFMQEPMKKPKGRTGGGINSARVGKNLGGGRRAMKKDPKDFNEFLN